MNYSKIYTQIIERAKGRQLDSYKESHHIIPKCMGGSDDGSNLVDLTSKEHFICHQLLCKIYPSHRGLAFAAWMLSSRGSIKTSCNFVRLREHYNKQRCVNYISKVCRHCNKSFDVIPSREHTSKFCSKECFDNSKQNKQERSCIVCDKSFQTTTSRDAACCSYKCSRVKASSSKKRRVSLYDNEDNCWLTFESRKEATKKLNLNVGDCSSLLKGRIKSLKKGRFTTFAPSSSTQQRS